EDDEELHVVVRDRLGGRLDEEDIGTADAMPDLDIDLAIGEARDPHVLERLVQRLGDFLRQLGISVTREQLQCPGLPRRPLGRLRPRIDPLDDPSGLCYLLATAFWRARRRAAYPSTIFISGRPIARLPAGTSFVTTVSAAVAASLPTRT